MPPFPKKYSTPSQVAVRVVLLRSCLSALYIHIKNVWVRTLMIDTPPTTSHAPPIHQRSHPWQLRRVTRPTLVVLWSVWTPTRATVTGTVRRWTDVRRWEKRRVKKLLPCHHTCSLFIYLFFGDCIFFWMTSLCFTLRNFVWNHIIHVLYLFYINFLFVLSDLRYLLFIFLYIFLLTVFIVMHQNINANSSHVWTFSDFDFWLSSKQIYQKNLDLTSVACIFSIVSYS